jgi:hypothetical protein
MIGPNISPEMQAEAEAAARAAAMVEASPAVGMMMGPLTPGGPNTEGPLTDLGNWLGPRQFVKDWFGDIGGRFNAQFAAEAAAAEELAASPWLSQPAGAVGPTEQLTETLGDFGGWLGDTAGQINTSAGGFGDWLNSTLGIKTKGGIEYAPTQPMRKGPMGAPYMTVPVTSIPALLGQAMSPVATLFGQMLSPQGPSAPTAEEIASVQAEINKNRVNSLLQESMAPIIGPSPKPIAPMPSSLTPEQQKDRDRANLLLGESIAAMAPQVPTSATGGVYMTPLSVPESPAVAGQPAAEMPGVSTSVTITPEQATVIADANIKAVADAMVVSSTSGFTASALLIVQNMAKGLSGAIGGGASATEGLSTAAAGAAGPFSAIGTTIIAAISTGAIEAMDKLIKDVVAKLGELITTLTSEDNLKSSTKAGEKVGDSITGGIIEGLSGTDARSKFKGAADEIINYIKQVLKDAALAKSPSKLFRDEVGHNLTSGIAVGLIDRPAQHMLTTSANRLIDYTANAVNLRKMYNESGVYNTTRPAETNMRSTTNVNNE